MEREVSTLFCVGMSISSRWLQSIARPERQRQKGERHCDHADRDAQGADVEPAIAIEGIEYPAAGQWTERHADHYAVRKLEFDERCRPACQQQSEPGQNRARTHDD